jgi:hypothetical protein
MAMNELQPWQQLLQMMTGSWVSRAIYVAAKLKLADQLKNGPRTADDIAQSMDVKSRPLHRFLRALAGVGVFDQESEWLFSLNPLGTLLCDQAEGSLRALAIHMGEEPDRCWGNLLETLRTGQPAFQRLYGKPVFD